MKSLSALGLAADIIPAIFIHAWKLHFFLLSQGKPDYSVDHREANFMRLSSHGELHLFKAEYTGEEDGNRGRKTTTPSENKTYLRKKTRCVFVLTALLPTEESNKKLQQDC